MFIEFCAVMYTAADFGPISPLSYVTIFFGLMWSPHQELE